MSVEILIYTYLAICAGMIVFNIVTVVLSRHKRLRSFSASIRLELRIADEIDRLPAGGEVSPAHLRYIERKLRRADNMAAFDAAMERLCLRRAGSSSPRVSDGAGRRVHRHGGALLTPQRLCPEHHRSGDRPDEPTSL